MKLPELTKRERRLGAGTLGLLVLVILYGAVVDGYLPVRAELTASLTQESARYVRLKRQASLARVEDANASPPAESATPVPTSESDLIEAIYAGADKQLRLRSVEPRYEDGALVLSLSGAGAARAAGHLLRQLEVMDGTVKDLRLTAAQAQPGTVVFHVTCRFDHVR